MGKNPSLKSETSLPVVCSGLTHALFVVGHLFVDEGDEIIIPDLSLPLQLVHTNSILNIL